MSYIETKDKSGRSIYFHVVGGKRYRTTAKKYHEREIHRDKTQRESQPRFPVVEDFLPRQLPKPRFPIIEESQPRVSETRPRFPIIEETRPRVSGPRPRFPIIEETRPRPRVRGSRPRFPIIEETRPLPSEEFHPQFPPLPSEEFPPQFPPLPSENEGVLEGYLSKCEQKLDELQGRLDPCEGLSLTQKAEISRLTQNLSDKIDEMKQLTIKYQQLNDKHSQCEKHFNELSTTHKTHGETIEKFEEKFSQMQKANELYIDNLKRCEDSLKQKMDEINILDKKLEEKTKNNDSLRMQVEEMNVEIQKYKENVNILASKSDNRKRSIQSLRQLIGQMCTEIKQNTTLLGRLPFCANYDPRKKFHDVDIEYLPHPRGRAPPPPI